MRQRFHQLARPLFGCARQRCSRIGIDYLRKISLASHFPFHASISANLVLVCINFGDHNKSQFRANSALRILIHALSILIHAWNQKRFLNLQKYLRIEKRLGASWRLRD
jgi:hypothetical protein